MNKVAYSNAPYVDVPDIDTYFGGKGGSGVYQAIINQIPPHNSFVSGFLGHCAPDEAAGADEYRHRHKQQGGGCLAKSHPARPAEAAGSAGG